MIAVMLYAGHIGRGPNREVIHSVLKDGVAIAEVSEGQCEIRITPIRRLSMHEDAMVRKFAEALILGEYRGARGERALDTAIYVTVGQ